MTFFCVKTRIFATKVHFLLDNAKVLREKSKRGRCGGTQERKIDALFYFSNFSVSYSKITNLKCLY